MEQTHEKKGWMWALALIPLGILAGFLEGPLHYIARNESQYHIHPDSDDFLIIGVFIAFALWLEWLREKVHPLVRVTCMLVALMAATWLGERYDWPH